MCRAHQGFCDSDRADQSWTEMQPPGSAEEGFRLSLNSSCCVYSKQKASGPASQTLGEGREEGSSCYHKGLGSRDKCGAIITMFHSLSFW
jgi:hypothetical protein